MSEVKFETVEQKASYGIGLQMGQQLAGSGLEGLNVDAIAAGIATALVGDMPAIEVDEINNALQELHTRGEAARQELAKAAAADGEGGVSRPDRCCCSLATLAFNTAKMASLLPSRSAREEMRALPAASPAAARPAAMAWTAMA